jgi:hypothetical protein
MTMAYRSTLLRAAEGFADATFACVSTAQTQRLSPAPTCRHARARPVSSTTVRAHTGGDKSGLPFIGRTDVSHRCGSSLAHSGVAAASVAPPVCTSNPPRACRAASTASFGKPTAVLRLAALRLPASTRHHPAPAVRRAELATHVAPFYGEAGMSLGWLRCAYPVRRSSTTTQARSNHSSLCCTRPFSTLTTKAAAPDSTSEARPCALAPGQHASCRRAAHIPGSWRTFVHASRLSAPRRVSS